MGWISTQDKIPSKEGYYRCLAIGFSKPIRCKFKKEEKAPFVYFPACFIYKKRMPFVMWWKEI